MKGGGEGEGEGEGRGEMVNTSYYINTLAAEWPDRHLPLLEAEVTQECIQCGERKLRPLDHIACRTGPQAAYRVGQCQDEGHTQYTGHGH